MEIPNIQVLQVERHTNKLKIGHLAGNRFRIKIRQVTEQALPTAQDILNRLEKKGVPNYFGQQRFGNRNNSHILGELIVRQNVTEFVAEFLGRPQSNESQAIQEARRRVDTGRWAEALSQWPRNFNDERRVLETIVKADGQLTDAVFKSLNGKLKSFLVSAFQAHLFNDLLSRRLPYLDQLQIGDVAYIHNKGAAFIVEDVDREQPRADRFEISPAGPLFGPKLLAAEGVPGEEEAQVLLSRNLSPASFKVPGVKLRGARRPYRIPLKVAEVWWDDGLMVSFELPPGAYATTVLAEIMK